MTTDMAGEANSKSSHRDANKCALCLDGHASERGHVIPRFVYRYLIKTSPTGFLRGTQRPNKRLQDGKTRRFLCPRCEDAISRWETEFSRHVFNPVHKQDLFQKLQPFEYREWLHRFLVSVSWRSLYDLDTSNVGAFPHGDDSAVEQALTVWQQYLLGLRADVGEFNQHIVFFDTPGSTRGIENSVDLAIYMNRAVTHTTFHSSSDSYVFTKLCRIVVVGTIKDTLRGWRGTAVSPLGGVFQFGDQVVSGVLFRWLQADIEGMRAGRQKISQKQHRVLDEAIRRALRPNDGNATVDRSPL